VQLCAPRNSICYFQSLKDQKEKQKLDYMLFNMPKVSTIYVTGGAGTGARGSESHNTTWESHIHPC